MSRPIGSEGDVPVIRPVDITGLILAGGQASRFQRKGQSRVDKGLLHLNDQPLVAHVHQFLVPRVGAVWVSANGNQYCYQAYGQVVADDPVYGGAAGPLAGVATALAQLQTAWLLTLPVDTPVLPENLLTRLLAAAADGCLLASATTPHQAYPLCMLVHRSLAGGLHNYLISGQRKVQLWQQQARGCEVSFEPRGHDFFNVNTPEALHALQRGGSGFS